jgi:hypothetical protein
LERKRTQVGYDTGIEFPAEFTRVKAKTLSGVGSGSRLGWVRVEKPGYGEFLIWGSRVSWAIRVKLGYGKTLNPNWVEPYPLTRVGLAGLTLNSPLYKFKFF